jgi:hypothetical protein
MSMLGPLMPATPAITVADLHEDARQLVTEGVLHDKQIVDILTSWFTVNLETGKMIRDPSVVRPIARLATAAAVGAHRRRQARWPAVTDCDKLDEAFVLLNRRGVVARHNYKDCASDGLAEIGEEMADAQAGRKRPVVGYAFYHSQATERAIAGGPLSIMYGSALVNDVAGDKAVGRRVVRALREAGLSPTGSGDPTDRVLVPLKWQRRRPEPAA